MHNSIAQSHFQAFLFHVIGAVGERLAEDAGTF